MEAFYGNKEIEKIYTCFPGGRHKALTFSYDDGREEDRRLVELLNRHGLRGTFNLNSGMTDDPWRIPQREYGKLYQGHEIACHTSLHPTIARSPIDQVARQILEDRMILEDLTGGPVRGLAYPNGSYSRRIMELLPMLGIRYARIVPTTGAFEMPENWFAWAGTCHHNQDLLQRGEDFLGRHKTQYLNLMYVWGHSYEFTTYDNWNVIEDFCAMVSGHDEIWYATNIEIVDYMDAAERLQFTAAGDRVYNPSACTVWLEVDGRSVEAPGGEMVAI